MRMKRRDFLKLGALATVAPAITLVGDEKDIWYTSREGGAWQPARLALSKSTSIKIIENWLKGGLWVPGRLSLLQIENRECWQFVQFSALKFNDGRIWDSVMGCFRDEFADKIFKQKQIPIEINGKTSFIPFHTEI